MSVGKIPFKTGTTIVILGFALRNASKRRSQNDGDLTRCRLLCSINPRHLPKIDPGETSAGGDGGEATQRWPIAFAAGDPLIARPSAGFADRLCFSATHVSNIYFLPGLLEHFMNSSPFSFAFAVFGDLMAETAKYAFPLREFEARNLEEALMSVPDLETVTYKALKRTEQYEIRQVEPYFVAETTMPGDTGFDLNGASQSFNVLAAYLFGKNTKREQMEMTTPVYTRKVQDDGEKMDMTTPVITKQSGDGGKWQMSFVMPSKYGADLPSPKDESVSITEVPGKVVAVTAFSGFVTDEDVKFRESKLRKALRSDPQYQVKEEASVEVAQFNPPFTLPFTRRNEIALEVEVKA